MWMWRGKRIGPGFTWLDDVQILTRHKGLLKSHFVSEKPKKGAWPPSHSLQNVNAFALHGLRQTSIRATARWLRWREW
jgi:hypothetical protein